MPEPSEDGPSHEGRATLLLRRYRQGDAAALEDLMPLVYETLHGIAAKMMGGERKNHTLQPTALVNEAWLRLAGTHDKSYEDRDHFLRIAARAMRRVLIDHARSKVRIKRGKGCVVEELKPELLFAEDRGPQLIEFDEALTRLEAMDERLARIVELRFFGGHSIKDSARILNVSHATVERDWQVAKLFLAKDLDEHGS